jgi:hypothetical protein
MGRTHTCAGARDREWRIKGHEGIVTLKGTQTEQSHHNHAQYNEVNVKCGHYKVQTKNDHVQ